MRTAFAAAAAICLVQSGVPVREAQAAPEARTERRELPAFDAIEVSSGIRATVSVGPQAPLELEGAPSALERVETRVEDGTLKLRFRRHFGFGSDEQVRVRITVPRLRAAEASGGSIIRASLAPVDALRLGASGGGEVHVSGIEARELELSGSGGALLDLQGSAERVSLEMSGGTRVRAARFAARSLRVSGSGGCDGEMRVASSARGELSGGSSLRLIGSPSTQVSTSGGSSVETQP